MAFSSYEEVIDHLYTNLPMYQRVGAIAYREDLGNTVALCDALGNPERQFRSVHVAGTNGKGSTSHMLAAVLQCAGYKTGLYTSPHLKEFTERIRINGAEINQSFIIDFVNRIKPVMDQVKPSFFEITVAMAYDFFARQQVDIAIVEVGLGGRLDSTNVITPLVSVICSIGYDHQNILGDTLEKIAYEKAGIIKPKVPVVISQTQAAVKKVFERRAAAVDAPIFFADQVFRAEITGDNLKISTDQETLIVPGFPLGGLYQQKNIPGVMMCIEKLKGSGMSVDQAAVRKGLAGVVNLTSLHGRWQKLNEHPLIICDTGHNPDGISEVVAQIRREKFDKLFMIIGMVKDKDIKEVLSLLPREAEYFFCEAAIPRALEAELLAGQARDLGLKGTVVKDVNEAIRSAKRAAGPGDFIFVGGSTFVVAEIEGLI